MTRLSRWLLGVVCAGGLLLAAGGGPGPLAGPSPDYPRILWEHLATQVSFGPRPPGSAGHLNARQYIKSVAGGLGLEVREMRFAHSTSGGALWLSNLEIPLPGREAGRPVLLGAHYDTRPFSDEDPEPANRTKPLLGANDGASGTAVLLGLARYFRDHPPRRPVRLVFFDGEDYGRKFSDEYFLGSREYARSLRRLDRDRWPFCVLIIDMVGDRDLQIYKEVYSHESAPWLLDLIFKTARRLGYTPFIPKPRHTIRDDHLAFQALGLPAAVLIDFDYPYWHTQEDTLDKCSPESLFQVFSVVAEVVGNL